MPSKHFPILLCVLLCACGTSRDSALSGEVADLSAQLGEARLQVQLLRKENATLTEQVLASRALALQLQRDVVYLQTSDSQLADAVNRLSYEDWSKVVPDIQLRFSDVEGASQDLGAHTTQVVNALQPER